MILYDLCKQNNNTINYKSQMDGRHLDIDRAISLMTSSCAIPQLICAVIKSKSSCGSRKRAQIEREQWDRTKPDVPLDEVHITSGTRLAARSGEPSDSRPGMTLRPDLSSHLPDGHQ